MHEYILDNTAYNAYFSSSDLDLIGPTSLATELLALAKTIHTLLCEQDQAEKLG